MSKRVEKIVREFKWGVNRSQAREALDLGWVLKNGKKLDPGDRVNSASELDFSKLEEEFIKNRLGNECKKVQRVAVEQDFVIVHKPAEMHGHPLSIAEKNTLTHWAFFHYPKTRDSYLEFQPVGVPHRLDYATEGLQIVALNPKMYDEIRQEFKQKKVVKKYLAWVWGQFKGQVQSHLEMAHHPSFEHKMIIVSEGIRYRGEPQATASTARLISRSDDRSLVEVQCTSGAMHQVRVHLAHLGFPLLGDSIYDDQYESRPQKVPYHLLLASELNLFGKTYQAQSALFRDPSLRSG